MKNFISIIIDNDGINESRDFVLDTVLNTANIGLLENTMEYEIYESENNTQVLSIPIARELNEKQQAYLAKKLANKMFDKGYNNFDIEFSLSEATLNEAAPTTFTPTHYGGIGGANNVMLHTDGNLYFQRQRQDGQPGREIVRWNGNPTGEGILGDWNPATIKGTIVNGQRVPYPAGTNFNNAPRTTAPAATTAAAPAAASTTPTGGLLRRGNRGEEVKQLQRDLGMTGDEIDGIFGPATERAVRTFQQTSGSKVDGLVGPETRAAITKYQGDDDDNAATVTPDADTDASTVNAPTTSIRPQARPGADTDGRTAAEIAAGAGDAAIDNKMNRDNAAPVDAAADTGTDGRIQGDIPPEVAAQIRQMNADMYNINYAGILELVDRYEKLYVSYNSAPTEDNPNETVYAWLQRMANQGTTQGTTVPDAGGGRGDGNAEVDQRRGDSTRDNAGQGRFANFNPDGTVDGPGQAARPGRRAAPVAEPANPTGGGRGDGNAEVDQRRRDGNAADDDEVMSQPVEPEVVEPGASGGPTTRPNNRPTYTGDFAEDRMTFFKTPMARSDAEAFIAAISLEGKDIEALLDIENNLKSVMGVLNGNQRVPDEAGETNGGKIVQKGDAVEVIRAYRQGPLMDAQRNPVDADEPEANADPDANDPRGRDQRNTPPRAGQAGAADDDTVMSQPVAPEVTTDAQANSILQNPNASAAERNAAQDYYNTKDDSAVGAAPSAAADEFYQAMKGGTGIGTDKPAIQSQLENMKSADEFVAAEKAYSEKYDGRSLIGDFYDEMSTRHLDRFVMPEFERLGLQLPTRDEAKNGAGAIVQNNESVEPMPKGAFMVEDRAIWRSLYESTHYTNGKPRPRTFISESKRTIPEITFEDDDKFFENYGVMWFNEDEMIDEAEYQGRKVKLGKPMAGDVKKFKVYVKNPKGNVVKVNFGQKGAKIKKNNPERRRSFRARHNCDNPGPRHKARYWSCRKW